MTLLGMQPMKTKIPISVLATALVASLITSWHYYHKSNVLAAQYRDADEWANYIEDYACQIEGLYLIEKAILLHVRDHKEVPPFGTNIVETLKRYLPQTDVISYQPFLYRFTKDLIITSAGTDAIFDTSDDTDLPVREFEINAWKSGEPIRFYDNYYGPKVILDEEHNQELEPTSPTPVD